MASGPTRSRSARSASPSDARSGCADASTPTARSVAQIGCRWLSVSPGTIASLLPSTFSVRASHASRTSASDPTATIVPSRMATAVAAGRSGSSVRTRAPVTARSAAVRWLIPGVIDLRAMRLLPAEQERLLLFLAAELARARRARGLALNQAEASAIVADAVCEAARDGCSYAEAQARGRAALSLADVLDGVRVLLPRVEVDALFADGRRLVVLEDPLGDAAPDRDGEPDPPWLAAAAVELEVVNEAD